MFFSKEKWAGSDEIQPYLQTSAALSFNKCRSAFDAACEKYLVPIFGETILQQVLDIYKATETPEQPHRKLLEHMQRAEANLAFYENFDEFQVRVTDQGIQRQETEKFKQAYRYQEVNMRQLYHNRGLGALEAAMRYLDTNAKDFPSWHDTEYCTARRTLIVRSASEIHKLHFINNSQIIYLRLLPSIRIISDVELPKVITRKLHAALIKALADGSEYIGENKAITAESFRESCAAYVIFKALAQLIRETGSVTDRGLYFEAGKATFPNPVDETPGSRSQIAALASQFDDSAYKYANALQGIVENCFPEYYEGSESDVYKRDNRNKRMVWL